MKTLIKMSMKLLVRTKIIWLFIVFMPILSTFLLKGNTHYTAFVEEDELVVELDSADEKVAYYGANGEYIVKVYDASNTELSNYLLDRLGNSGLFTICRADISEKEVTDEFIKDRIEFDAYEDRMGSALYIPADFDEKMLEGKMDEALTMYVLSDDSRTDALENELTLQLSRIDTAKDYIVEADSEAEEIVENLKSVDDMTPEKEVTAVAGSGNNLTQEQSDQKAQMGYAFSFLTLGFVFAGFFVANGAIKEQKNGVFTRVSLSKTNVLTYFASKFVTVFLVSVLMTGVVAVCSLMIDMNDVGMSRPVFVLIIFMMGLIFSSLSMFMGIMMNDVFGASVATFTLWCMSSLFSGSYFPLDSASKAIKVISALMPQKWFLQGTEMIFVGDNKAYGMLICITVAYLAVILSLGGIGLKVRRSEEWGES